MPVILAAAAVEGAGGAAQFGLSVGHVVMQVVSFTILAVVLYRWGLKPVLATMDERNQKIADGLRYAEEMKARLAEAEKQHADTLKQAALEAQRIVEQARVAAKELVDRETRQATDRAQQIITKAEEAIELDRRKMLAEAREEIARLVAVTASRVLSRELNSDERRRYAEAAARELAEV